MMSIKNALPQATIETTHEMYTANNQNLGHEETTTSSRVNNTGRHSRFVSKVTNWYLLIVSIQENVRQKLQSCKTPSENILRLKNTMPTEINI